MQRDELLVAELISAATKLIDLLGDRSPERLADDEMRRDAVLWNFAVLGEAAGQVSDELKEAHPAIPWRRPAQLRNRIIHGYWEVDLEIIVGTIRNDLPAFIQRLREITPDL